MDRSSPEMTEAGRQINRRQFIRYAVLGLGAAGAAGLAGGTLFQWLRTPGTVARVSRRFAITEALVQMIDGQEIYHWAFEDLDNPMHLPQMPGPLIEAVEGDAVELSITNNLPAVHGFRIPGAPGETGNGIEIKPGETAVLSFPAPEGGSYMYLDHLNAPVNRVLGLHGPMAVLPAMGNTPYSRPTPNVQKLFDHLGATEHFPGEPWKPEHSRIWIFHSIDPKFNAMAEKGEPIDAARFKEEFVARYFTINGESGALSSHNHHTTPEGRIGQPHLIRIMDTGMTADSPHIHGNHVYLLAIRDIGGNLRIQESVPMVDTFTDEVSQCMDWLLPFIRPPDIPGDHLIPLRRLIPRELALTLGGVGQSPLMYPMHGHNEQSQSAAGGNYPQGMVTGWIITGDLDGVSFPPANPEEKGGPPETH
ncbi:MAG: multicopper oxidase domain-containing protein [Chloroflexi bacterium]|nr:multicopper oxidase domain-containing protein [Chloroflexota bacterium]